MQQQQQQQESSEDVEEAVEPGSKKRKVCSSVQACAHAPMRPCARARAKYAGPVDPRVQPSRGSRWLAMHPWLREEDGNIWCYPCAVAEDKVSHLGMHGWQQGVQGGLGYAK